MAFQIDVQQDAVRGCIPACASSVVRHLGKGNVSEQDLIHEMYATRDGSASGFELLERALAARGIPLTVEVPANYLGGITDLTDKGTLVLVAVCVSNDRAHCVVVESVAGAELVLHDPASGQKQTVLSASLASVATGDIAFLP
jgi:ABC-type bacteriocin/lantibiotic exporter with double-glycine peptidase domain